MNLIVKDGVEFAVHVVDDQPGRTDEPTLPPFPLGSDSRKIGRATWRVQLRPDGPLSLIQRGNILTARVIRDAEGNATFVDVTVFGTEGEYRAWLGL